MNSSEFAQVEHHARVDLSRLEAWPEASKVHPSNVLSELTVLLEDYAPTWYSEELRGRILTAMRLPTDVLVEVCALLEDYAPSWYTDEPRKRALDTLQALGLLESEPITESDDNTPRR